MFSFSGSYAALEWGITPYLMSDPRHQSGLASSVGVELSVNGSEWTEMRFRMTNYHLCKGHSNAGVITFAMENVHTLLFGSS